VSIDGECYEITCNSEGCPCGALFESVEDAKMAWNTRALEAENAALKARGPVLGEDEIAARERVELIMVKRIRKSCEVAEAATELPVEIDTSELISAMASEREVLRVMRNLLERAKR